MQKKQILTFYFWLALAFCTIAQTQSYKRIVSLAPSLTQSLYYLQAQDRLVGCTSYCQAAKGDKKQVVASAVKINMEKVVSVKPDLVIASGLANPEDLETLRKFGIRVEVYPTPKSFDEICRQFTALGKLVGKAAEAEKIVSDSRRKIADIQARRKDKPKPNMFFQIGANPLFTVIPNTFMDDYMTFIGGKNIASELKRGTVGREFVIAKNTDYLFIVTMGIVGDEEKNVWSQYANLSAARNKQIFIIDSEIACQPTPVTFTKTMEILDKLVKK